MAFFYSCCWPSFSAVLHPYEGDWSPVRAYIEGEEKSPGRIYLKIENGKADISSYWSCGDRESILADGEVEVNGNELILYGRNEAGERYPRPNAKLQRLKNGHLNCQLDLGGKMATVELSVKGP